MQLVTCETCGLVQRLDGLPPNTAAECHRCGATVAKRGKNSLQKTAAFTLAALVCYVPANIYPILRMDYHGAYSESTVWDGCRRLFQSGQWVVAMIVFGASILIPLAKLLGLLFLVTTTQARSSRWQLERTRIYQFVHLAGPWAMLDVFLLSILVALMKLNQLATIRPGLGAVAFTAVVVFTMLAVISFDPARIWRHEVDSP